jgi:hypothetical protein
MDVEFAALRQDVISSSLEIWIGQQLTNTRQLREKVKETGRMEKCGEAVTGFAEVHGRTEIHLFEIFIIKSHPAIAGEWRYLPSQIIYQVNRKQVIDYDVWEGLGGLIAVPQILQTVRKSDVFFQSGYDTGRIIHGISKVGSVRLEQHNLAVVWGKIEDMAI